MPAGGALLLKVGSSPIYVVHKAADTQSVSAPPNNVAVAPSPATPIKGSPPANPDCAASQKNDIHMAGSSYFEQTGHNLGGPFRAYWETHGSTDVLGYPVTEEFTATLQDGKAYRQQIFQRARMEYHPENTPPNDVQLGLLGVWLSQGRNFSRMPAPGNTLTTYFAQTGHTLSVFKEWWTSHGSVGVFGLPLSEEMQEKNSADGKVYTVQYFERNRLESHPEYAGSDNSVLLGLLGAEYLSAQGCAR
ncbi:MAG: hypothetical protein M3014_06155 [Chloroflexota bacterium]|nr:hypothetical protein [Chloroflexota bacterium]